MARNKETDAYIAKAQPFAQPILKKLRTVIHKACPTAVEEIKWGKPFYLYNDRVLCATMGFKNHCAVVFWKGGLLGQESATAKAQLKSLRRIATLGDLPADAVLVGLLKRAMHFNEATTKLPSREQRSAATMPKMHKDFELALKRNARARKEFAAFSNSKKKEYIFWIASAKTDETRETRIEQAVDWIADGKSRNWKYEQRSKKSK